MMQGVVTRGTGVPAGKGMNRPLAGKTGTSQDFNDAWFAGFSPQLVTVVWVGYDNPASLGHDQTGAEVAAPIWHDFMAAALKGRPVLQFPMPAGVEMAAWTSGPGRVTDAFKPGQEPGASAPLGGEFDRLARRRRRCGHRSVGRAARRTGRGHLPGRAVLSPPCRPNPRP